MFTPSDTSLPVRLTQSDKDNGETSASTSDTSLPVRSPSTSRASPTSLVDSDSPDVINAKQFFKLFNIKKGVDLMVEAWRVINEATVRHGWKNLLKAFGLDDAAGNRQTQEASVEAVVKAANAVRIIGYDQVTAEEVNELIGKTQTSVDDVEEMMDTDAIESVDEQQEVIRNGEPTMAKLTDILGCAEVLREKIAESDATDERRDASIAHLMQCIEKYRQLHQQKLNSRQQTLISRYLARRPTTPPPPPPPVTPQSPEPDHVIQDGETYMDMGNDFEGFVLEDPSLTVE